jgi:hypothetical protein
MGAAAIPFVLTAIAGGANAYNTRQVARDQDQMAARGIRTQQEKQRQIDSRLSGEIGSLEQSNPDDERAASLDAFLQQLRATKGEAQGETTPGVSRYGQDTELAQAGVQNYGTKVADILSRLRGPVEQRRNEGYGFNRAGSDAATIARDAQGQAYLNRLRIGNIQRNPWIDAAAQLASGAAGGIAGQPSADEAIFAQAGQAGLEPASPNVWGGASATSARRRLPVYNQRVG